MSCPLPHMSTQPPRNTVQRARQPIPGGVLKKCPRQYTAHHEYTATQEYTPARTTTHMSRGLKNVVVSTQHPMSTQPPLTELHWPVTQHPSGVASSITAEFTERQATPRSEKRSAPEQHPISTQPTISTQPRISTQPTNIT